MVEPLDLDAPAEYVTHKVPDNAHDLANLMWERANTAESELVSAHRDYAESLYTERRRAERAEAALALAVEASCRPEPSGEVMRTYSNSLYNRMVKAESAIARVEELCREPVGVFTAETVLAALRGDPVP